MDLSSVHGNKLQTLFSHHYKSVDVRVQIKAMFLFFPILRRKFLFFPIFQHFHSNFPIFFLQVIWHLTPCLCDVSNITEKLVMSQVLRNTFLTDLLRIFVRKS